MGASKSSSSDLKETYTKAAATGVPKTVYKGATLQAGTFFSPRMNPAYGGKRVSMLPPDITDRTLLSVSLGLDVSGSNKAAAKSVHADFPQFWELMNYLLPKDKYHLNLQFGAIDDWQDEVGVQLGYFEGDALKVEQALRELYPVGHGWTNLQEAYAEYMWLLANFNRLQVWEKGKRGFAFIMFDEGFETEFPASHLRKIFTSSDGVITDKMTNDSSLSAGMRQLTEINLPSDTTMIKTADIVAQLHTQYHLYGVSCREHENYGRDYAEKTEQEWRDLLGAEHVVVLNDSSNISELIAAMVARLVGVGKNKIMSALEDTGTLLGSGKQDITTAIELVKPSTGISTNNAIKRF